MLLKGESIVIFAGERKLMTIDRLVINEGDRIGLVGPNGAGKSTLLAHLSGALSPAAGEIKRHSAISLITQGSDGSGEVAAKWAKRLSVGKEARSGGERTRRAIAVALSQEAPLLLADEPTTNLDIDGIILTESLLRDYDGAVVVVSHDRKLLDNVCTIIWAIEPGGFRIFHGNYSAYLAQVALERAYALEQYQQYRCEKSRLESAARQVKASAKAVTNTRHLSASEIRLPGMKGVYAAKQRSVDKVSKSIEKRIEHLTIREKPQALPTVQMKLGMVTAITARKALSVNHLTVRIGDRVIISEAAFSLPTGSRTVIIGANGAGKSTLVKALLADDPAVTKANGLKIGYFAQGHEQLAAEQTVLANVQTHSTLSEHEIRAILAQLNLTSETLGKMIGQLSGGQRAKVAFAQLLASDCNLLILDEPTNHLDTFAAEGLENLLAQWSGTLLVVTHDRQLADKIADHLLIVDNGQVTAFSGNWSDYLTARAKPKADWQTQQLDAAIMEMRMAEITGKMAAARQKKQDTTELETQWQTLLTDLSRLRTKGE